MLFWQDTDSVFMRFECRHPDGTKMTGLDAVRESMRLSIEASNAVSDCLPYPQELSYEKVEIYSFLLDFTRFTQTADTTKKGYLPPG